jgi:hypothetical protein
MGRENERACGSRRRSRLRARTETVVPSFPEYADVDVAPDPGFVERVVAIERFRGPSILSFDDEHAPDRNFLVVGEERACDHKTNGRGFQVILMLLKMLVAKGLPVRSVQAMDAEKHLYPPSGHSHDVLKYIFL